MDKEQFFSKEDLIKKLKEIKEMGWIKTKRPGNDGAVGNTLEDLLEITENNLPIPNAAEWELKAQRKSTTSLTTLFHLEPSPQAAKIVPQILLPKYGWPHKQAGKKYQIGEKSFRSTTNAINYTDRGFKILVDKDYKKVKFHFNPEKINREKHNEWITGLEDNFLIKEFDPEPYWGFKDLMYKAGTKLKNTFYVLAENKYIGKDEYFYFSDVYILKDFSFDDFIKCIEEGYILIDYDARTGHNHGTKFRIKQNIWPKLYKSVEKII
jgi:hypothetical protein